jgi:hypothetical protein
MREEGEFPDQNKVRSGWQLGCYASCPPFFHFYRGGGSFIKMGCGTSRGITLILPQPQPSAAANDFFLLEGQSMLC